VSQVTSVVDMAVEIIDANGAAGGSISFLRTFRIFRALRPLRIISRSKGLKLVLQTVTRAIIPVMNTILIALAVFFVFGIMAVQLLGGRTAYCTDITIETKLGCQGVDPHSGEIRLWRQRQLTYGNIGDAMLSMFILASQVLAASSRPAAPGRALPARELSLSGDQGSSALRRWASCAGRDRITGSTTCTRGWTRPSTSTAPWRTRTP